MHVVLSPQGCKLGEWLLYALVQRTTVHANIFLFDILDIEQGWRELLTISGRVYLPKEYLFIYAPLTAEDVRIHGLNMRAAIKYMTGREDAH